MFCSISGSVPEQPVVSKKSGHVFEKSLIDKYVRETGKCPVTQEELSSDDLLPLNVNKVVKPRTSTASSIPALLSLFHDEWDALMLEVHTLRQNYHNVRQELSHALYQHDAATRVIARLITERDDARRALENVRETLSAELAAKQAAAAAAASKPEAEPEEAPPAKKPKTREISEQITQELVQVNSELSKARKKRQISPTLATPDEIGAYGLVSSHPLHKTTQGGIVSVEFSPADESNVLTAGNDSTIQLFDISRGRLLASLEGHSKRVTSAKFITADTFISSSADKTSRLWRSTGEEGAFTCTVLDEHKGEVVGASVHPSRRYFVTASTDATWCFYDVETASCLKQVDADQEAYTSVSFHPDGLILGLGTEESVVRVWELRSKKNAAEFKGHSGKIRSLSFSENGYFLATAAEDGVKLWDLRKLKTFRTLTPYDGGAPCNSVAFDHSGLYLGVGGGDARVYGVKQDYSVVKSYSDVPKKGVHSLTFGADARKILIGAADHNLRVLGATTTPMAE